MNFAFKEYRCWISLHHPFHFYGLEIMDTNSFIHNIFITFFIQNHFHLFFIIPALFPYFLLLFLFLSPWLFIIKIHLFTIMYLWTFYHYFLCVMYSPLLLNDQCIYLPGAYKWYIELPNGTITPITIWWFYDRCAYLNIILFCYPNLIQYNLFFTVCSFLCHFVSCVVLSLHVTSLAPVTMHQHFVTSLT